MQAALTGGPGLRSWSRWAVGGWARGAGPRPRSIVTEAVAVLERSESISAAAAARRATRPPRKMTASSGSAAGDLNCRLMSTQKILPEFVVYLEIDFFS